MFGFNEKVDNAVLKPVAQGYRAVTPQMVRTGAVVIDVGINRLPDGRIVGDVDFEGVRQKASFISPVPGGVGPMTRAMLLHNTLVSAERGRNGDIPHLLAKGDAPDRVRPLS